MLFVEAAFDFCEVDGTPDAGFADGFLGVVKGLCEGDAGGLPATSDSGEEPRFIAVYFPEGAEPVEEFGADGDFTFAPAFGVGDADGEALSIDVLWADVYGFGEAEPALIKDGEEGSVTTVTKGPEEKADFFSGEDVWEWFFAADFDL